MNKSNWFIISMLLLICPLFLQAQVLQNDQEVSQDRQQRSEAASELGRDAIERRTLQICNDRILEAYEIGDMESVEAIKSDILDAMEREIIQAEQRLEESATMDRRKEIYQTLKTTSFSAGGDAAELQLVDEFIQIMEEMDKSPSDLEGRSN